MDLKIENEKIIIKVDDAFDGLTGNNLFSLIEKTLKTDKNVKTVILDMLTCNYINSSGISKLIEVFNLLKKIGFRIKIYQFATRCIEDI
ncbi:MAG: STAS domain-containing protein [Candidatus Hydrogenedentota bacterium]